MSAAGAARGTHTYATTDRLAEIKERLADITPAPWALNLERGDDWGTVWHLESGGPIAYVGDKYPRGDNCPLENMTLIAHAPEDLAWLVAEVERLRGIVAATEARA